MQKNFQVKEQEYQRAVSCLEFIRKQHVDESRIELLNQLKVLREEAVKLRSENELLKKQIYTNEIATKLQELDHLVATNRFRKTLNDKDVEISNLRNILKSNENKELHQQSTNLSKGKLTDHSHPLLKEANLSTDNRIVQKLYKKIFKNRTA